MLTESKGQVGAYTGTCDLEPSAPYGIAVIETQFGVFDVVQQDSPFAGLKPEKIDDIGPVTQWISAVYDRRVVYGKRSYEERIQAAEAERGMGETG